MSKGDKLHLETKTECKAGRAICYKNSSIRMNEKIAKCSNNHVMTLDSLQRSWRCNGGACGNPRTGRSDWPRDVMYYTCEQCDQDFCPTCFSVVEKTIIIKKTEYDEDPDEFKATQRVYCKLRNTYVKI